MKKFLTSICLMSLICTNFVFAIEDTNKDIDVSKNKKRIETPKFIKKDPGLIKLPNKTEIDKKAFQKKMAEDEKAYLEVKNSNNEGYYIFYKVADKIIRANDLDTQNWRFEIKSESDKINAYANAANHVVLYSSMIDSFYENEDALAQIIGHELSHHILGHMQKKLDYYEKIDKLNGGLILSSVFFPVLPIYVLYYIPAYCVYHKKIRNREYEADLEALTLMARAGYDVEAANDAMSLLAQLPELKTKYVEDTHPKTKDRMKKINEQIALLDINTLKIEGQKNLYEKPVMKIKRSSDKKTIVLVPQTGKIHGKVHYSQITTQQKVIYNAYSAYLENDMLLAENLFERAYNLDKKNFIPCLYLSYINEYNYKKNNNEETLKKARIWAKRAYKKQNTNKYTIKQKMEIETLYQKQKSQR